MVLGLYLGEHEQNVFPPPLPQHVGLCIKFLIQISINILLHFANKNFIQPLYNTVALQSSLDGAGGARGSKGSGGR